MELLLYTTARIPNRSYWALAIAPTAFPSGILLSVGAVCTCSRHLPSYDLATLLPRGRGQKRDETLISPVAFCSIHKLRWRYISLRSQLFTPVWQH